MAAPKRSNNLLILIGLVFLVVGAGLVIVLERSNDGAGTASSSTAGSDTVPVVVSKRAIQRGALGKDLGDAVEVKQVPAVSKPSDALVDLSELADRTALVDIAGGQTLRASFFRQTTARGAAIKIPDGKQALAVTVPFTQAVAGYVGQGDLVNVYALVTTRGDQLVPRCTRLCDNPGGSSPQSGSRLVLANVEVLDVSQEVAPSAAVETTATTAAGANRNAAAAPTITYLVAVDANQAERMVFFTTYTDLYLSLVPKGQPPASTSGRDQTTALRP